MKKSLLIPLLLCLSFIGYGQSEDAIKQECLKVLTRYSDILTSIKDSTSSPDKINKQKYAFVKLFSSAGIYNYDDITNNSGKPFISTKGYVQLFAKTFSKGTSVAIDTKKAFATPYTLNKKRNAYHVKVTARKTVAYNDGAGNPQKLNSTLEFVIRVHKEEGKTTQYTIDAVTKKGTSPKFRPLSKLQKWWVNLDSDWQKIIHDELRLGETPTDYYLKRVIGIRSLDLSGSTMTNFQPLLALRGLIKLDLSKSKIKDLNFLKNCARLKELNLSETKISSLVGMEKLVYMEILDISKNQLTDLSPIAGMKNLIELNFSNNQVEDLTPLAKCTKMRELRFNLNIVKDLNAIQNLAYMEKLHFGKNQDIESLAPLARMTRLVELNCFNSKVTTLIPIKHLKKITYLDIGYTKITSLTVFAHLKFLSYLNFSGNKIEDFSVLYKFPYIKYLNCSTTKISDITPINRMPGIVEFVANNTDFTKDDIAKFKKKHPKCKKIYYWK